MNFSTLSSPLECEGFGFLPWLPQSGSQLSFRSPVSVSLSAGQNLVLQSQSEIVANSPEIVMNAAVWQQSPWCIPAFQFFSIPDLSVSVSPPWLRRVSPGMLRMSIFPRHRTCPLVHLTCTFMGNHCCSPALRSLLFLLLQFLTVTVRTLVFTLKRF